LTAKEDVAKERVRAIGEFFETHVNVDMLLTAMEEPSPTPKRWEPPKATMSKSRGLYGAGQQIETFDQNRPSASSHLSSAEEGSFSGVRPRVAIAYDKAFSFYYHANRMVLENAGAQIIEFSPIFDSTLPAADLLYIGGGYPELYRNELEANAAMRAAIRRFIESGKRFYAECGGLMYLAESIGESEMVGVIPARIEMTELLVDFGYCEIRTNSQSILGPAGTVARGHQFHYSRCVGCNGQAYTVQQGLREYREGFILPNGIASYVHLHFLSNPDLAGNMLNS